MVAWPFSTRKDSGPSAVQSVDSGYGSMVSSTELASNPSTTTTGSVDSESQAPGAACAGSLKRISKRVAREHLEKLKGFKLTFGAPLIAHVRSKPPVKGRHQALHIDMKYLGETEQDARLTIIISCHPAYEKVVNSFLRDKKLAIQSFFNPGGVIPGTMGTDGPAEYIYVSVIPLAPTACAKILCQRPETSLPGLQLVGERLSYQSADGFQEATFGGFVGVCYDVGRWAVFGLTTSHLANWTLDEEATYSVITHIAHLRKTLKSIESNSSPENIWYFHKSFAQLGSLLSKWAQFEIEPVDGLPSGDYAKKRQRYVAIAHPMLNEVRGFVKKMEKFLRIIDTLNESERDAEMSCMSADIRTYVEKVNLFLKRQGAELGHAWVSSAIEMARTDEEVWKAAVDGSFESVKAEWREVHDNDYFDDLTGAGDVVAQSTDFPIREGFVNLDWALIRIPELDKKMAGAISAPGAKKLGAASVEKLLEQEDDMLEPSLLLNPGQSFPAVKPSGNFSYLCVPPSRDFVEVVEIPMDSLETPLGKGDSGSWVMTETGEVIGHLVATNAFGDALLIPMEAILEDIKSRLNADAISIPKEPIAMAFIDRFPQPANQTVIAKCQAFIRKVTTTDYGSEQGDGDAESTIFLDDWRAEIEEKLAAEEEQWQKLIAEHQELLKYYDMVKVRLGKERLAAILEYQWTVQEGYQRKAMEEQVEGDRARWSEQRARGAYQDSLRAAGNDHWSDTWWDCYLEKWNKDLGAWQAVNSNLRSQVEGLRRCKELIEFHQRKRYRDLDLHSAGSLALDDTDSLSTGPPRASLESMSSWPKPSRRRLLSLEPTKSPSDLVFSKASLDSGYGSVSTSAISSQCGSSTSNSLVAAMNSAHRLPQVWKSRPTMRPKIPIGGSTGRENSNNDEVFLLYEE